MQPLCKALRGITAHFGAPLAAWQQVLSRLLAHQGFLYSCILLSPAEPATWLQNQMLCLEVTLALPATA